MEEYFPVTHENILVPYLGNIYRSTYPPVTHEDNLVYLALMVYPIPSFFDPALEPQELPVIRMS